MKTISGQIVDVIAGKIFPGEVVFDDNPKKGRKFSNYKLLITNYELENTNIGKIIEIKKLKKAEDVLIMPGLVDAHIHIESSMLVPSRFAQMAVGHGTVATVSDPHEIANVLGVPGIDYMIKDGRKSPLKFFWTVPSCVPATNMETSGAKLDAEEVAKLLGRQEFVGLSEMMNYPGVINNDAEVIKKIEAAKKLGKPIDGHAPLLSGEDLKKYIGAGITTDHECLSSAEAEEKIKLGMKIWAREGSAAKNLDDLFEAIKKYPEQCGLCCDDLHPDDLRKGHINLLLKKLIGNGLDPILAMRLATLNPINHYKLPVGLLQPNDPADFIVVDNWKDFTVKETWIDGKLAAKNGKAMFIVRPRKIKNNFKIGFKQKKDIEINVGQPNEGLVKTRVIEAIDKQLITKEMMAELNTDKKGNVQIDLENDILKIVVAERYGGNKIGLGFIHNFGLKTGAIATSVGHDSHNILAVGTNDTDIVTAINELIKIRGGIVCVNKGKVFNKINLTIGGIMSTRHGKIIAKKYKKLKKNVKKMGSELTDPFMTLSFMALLVIPELKISDLGFFEVKEWEMVDVFVNKN